MRSQKNFIVLTCGPHVGQLLLAHYHAFIKGSAKSRYLPILVLGCWGCLVGHMLVPHKELRFILPIIPVIWLALGWLVSHIHKQFPKLAMFISIFLVVGMWWGRPHSLHPFATSSAASISYHLGKDLDCLATMGHYWIWTRGELGAQMPVPIHEVNIAKDLVAAGGLKCNHVMVAAGWGDYFQARAPHYHLVHQTRFGHRLYRR